jgi:cytochrome c
MKALRLLMALLAAVPAAQAADAAHGKQLFTACAYCHGLNGTGGAVGPSLKGVLNRPAGAIEGFPYSDALKMSGVTWTEVNLAEYLAHPDQKVPGTRMVYAGLSSKADIRDLIAYLKQIK